MGRQEIVRTVCVVVTFLNILCAVYYVVVHRPAVNVELLTRQAANQRMEHMAAQHHGFDAMVQFAKGSGNSDRPRPMDGNSSSDGDPRAVAQEYMDAHGIAAEWVRVPTHASWDTPSAHRRSAVRLVWWVLHAAMQALGDGSHSHADLPSVGEDPLIHLAVPFSGTDYLPWLDAKWMAELAPRPRQIPRMYDPQRRFLTVPVEALARFSMNGTVPLHYDMHHIVAAPHGHVHTSGDSDDAWLLEDADDRPSLGDSNSEEAVATTQVGDAIRPYRRVVARKDYVRILTTVLRMIETPTYDANIANARMQRAFVVRVQQLSADSIAGKDVLVFGSLTEPFLEVTMLGIGMARRVISVDHVAHFQSSDKRIVSFSEKAFWRCIKSRQHCPAWLPDSFRMPKSFAVIVAYNTVQHDGLGRYGDPLDPLGDVKLMWELRSLLSMDPKAVLLLGVPLGNDCIVFNRHRVYGRRRLPLLLMGYHVSGTNGFDEAMADGTTFGASWPTDPRCLGDAQRIPLLVLKKNVLIRHQHDAEGETDRRDEATAKFVPPAYVESWFRVPGLAGPYPLYG